MKIIVPINRWRLYTDDKEDEFSYEVPSRYWYHRQIVFGLIATAIGALLYYYIVEPLIIDYFDLYHRWVMVINLPPQLLPGIGTVFAFPSATFIGILMTQAITRYFNVGRALADIEGAVHGMIMNINSVDDPDKRGRAFMALRRVLRAFCSQACREDFTVCIQTKEGEKNLEYKNSMSVLFECFRQTLRDANLENVVIGNNGRVHSLNPAAATVEITARVAMPLNFYYCAGALLLAVYLLFAVQIALFAGEASKPIGVLFSAVVFGSGTLLIFAAQNRAIPFGRARSSYRIRSFYRDLENEITNATEVREYLNPQPALSRIS